MARIIIICILFIFSLILSVTALKCYDCDYENSGDNCLDPNSHEIQISTCKEESGKTPTCFSFRSNTTEGVHAYRGCYNPESSDNGCEELSERFQKYNVSKCEVCRTDSCNGLKLYRTDEVPLECYSCRADKDGAACLDPISNNISVEKCEPQINKTQLCVSYYLESEIIATTGAYRGCNYTDNTISNFCDLLKEEIVEGNVTFFDCTVCQQNECNNITMISKASGYTSDRTVLFSCLMYIFVLFTN